jgi:glycosyltransferase involved in cell wall biosynthesis
MKRILIITDNVREQINGVVTTFTNIELLARRDGYDIDYISPELFSSIPAPGYPEVRLAWPRKIGRLIQCRNPDYIHIATEGPIGLAARLWLDSRGWRYNTSYHTKFPEFLNRIYNIPECITYAYVRWFHKHSGRVLTTTDTMVRDLKDHGFKGDIRSWTRGVDRRIFDYNLRNRSDNEKILLNVGRVSKEKGLDDFCKLAIPGTRKIIVGDGPYKSELEKRYKDVEFVGVKTGRELAEYYANADVFVFPSKTDTFGVVIIESLACGTPVASYPVAGPKDIIDEGITGYMSNCLQDAVEICLDYPRDRVINASQRWTWNRCWQIFRENLVEKSATR